MESFSSLVQSGNAWVFIPSAILLGALHGLEPGHSKTMMAAFIVAVRGTVPQAILLGLSATLSHTAVVWAVAMGGLYLGRNWDAEATDPYFQIASAAIIIVVAFWMIWRTWREQRSASMAPGYDHDHGHHHHGEEIRRIDTGHGIAQLEIFEEGVPPRFRVRFDRANPVPKGQTVTIETTWASSKHQAFAMADRGAYLESVDEIPEPHEFIARLSIAHGGHAHSFDVEFTEHDRGHVHAGDHGLDVTDSDYQDAHQRAHANDIKQRFASRDVTTGQIVAFGLTGGLIPCPAAITVLLLCLQLKRFTLGASLVLCFSIGLAVTMVAAGVIAAISVRQVSRRWSGFEAFARRAPYASGALIILVGLYLGGQAFHTLAASGAL